MILGLCGIPRVKSTEYALREALRMLEESGSKMVPCGVRGNRIRFGIHCDSCQNWEGCLQWDDVQELYPLLDLVEIVMIAVIIYNGGVSHKFKTILDRDIAIFEENPAVLLGRPAFLTVGGDMSGGQKLAIQQIITFSTLNGANSLSVEAFGDNLRAPF